MAPSIYSTVPPAILGSPRPRARPARAGRGDHAARRSPRRGRRGRACVAHRRRPPMASTSASRPTRSSLLRLTTCVRADDRPLHRLPLAYPARGARGPDARRRQQPPVAAPAAPRAVPLRVGDPRERPRVWGSRVHLMDEHFRHRPDRWRRARGRCPSSRRSRAWSPMLRELSPRARPEGVSARPRRRPRRSADARRARPTPARSARTMRISIRGGRAAELLRQVRAWNLMFDRSVVGPDRDRRRPATARARRDSRRAGRPGGSRPPRRGRRPAAADVASRLFSSVVERLWCRSAPRPCSKVVAARDVRAPRDKRHRTSGMPRRRRVHVRAVPASHRNEARDVSRPPRRLRPSTGAGSRAPRRAAAPPRRPRRGR